MPPSRTFICLVIVASLFACGRSEGAPPDPSWIPRGGPAENPIISGPHEDEGPLTRWDHPYQPIVYGQSILAPLPALGYSHTLVDWDGDGLTDLLVKLRRGGGLVFYKNVGTEKEARFLSLHENRRLADGDFGDKYLDAIDVNGDGKMELAMFQAYPESSRETEGSNLRLIVYFNDGSQLEPAWRPVEVLIEGTSERLEPDAVRLESPRLRAADWNGDGKTDLIFGWERATDINPGYSGEDKGRQRGRWKGPDDGINPAVGRVLVALNLSESDPQSPPRFSRPIELEADGVPIRSHLVAYPNAYDINDDGRVDLIIGRDPLPSDKEPRTPVIEVFLRMADNTLQRAGFLEDEKGDEIRTALAIQTDFGDLNGDGRDDLVASSYFGNADRYLLFHAPSASGLSGWQSVGSLSFMARPDSPVYGMGNSTVDPIDWDGDGDIDLLLGAERGVPTVVINTGTTAKPVFQPAERLKFVDGTPWESYAIEIGNGSHWGVSEWYSDRVTPRAVDWDQDGTLDMISGSMGRRLHFSKGKMVDDELRFEHPVNLRVSGEDLVVPDRIQPAVTDWDEDGIPDLVVPFDIDTNDDTHPDRFAGQIRVFLGQGKAAPLELTAGETLRGPDGKPVKLSDYWERVSSNRSSLDVADWNGDGHRDLVAFMFHRGAFFAPGDGSGNFGQWEELVEIFSHNAGINVIDWDLDGIQDLLLGGDERRMIEPRIPAHIVVISGKDLPNAGRSKKLPNKSDLRSTSGLSGPSKPFESCLRLHQQETDILCRYHGNR